MFFRRNDYRGGWERTTEALRMLRALKERGRKVGDWVGKFFRETIIEWFGERGRRMANDGWSNLGLRAVAGMVSIQGQCVLSDGDSSFTICDRSAAVCTWRNGPMRWKGCGPIRRTQILDDLGAVDCSGDPPRSWPIWSSATVVADLAIGRGQRASCTIYYSTKVRVVDRVAENLILGR
jgi:hypothetical protein